MEITVYMIDISIVLWYYFIQYKYENKGVFGEWVTPFSGNVFLFLQNCNSNKRGEGKSIQKNICL